MSAGDRQLDDPILFSVQQVTLILRHPSIERYMRRLFKLDNTRDIPYLAGYSQDGKTIYIDRDMPESFEWNGKTVRTDKFLIDHEHMEKSVIDALREAESRELQRLLILLRMTNKNDRVYYHAHGVATTFEEYDVVTNLTPSAPPSMDSAEDAKRRLAIGQSGLKFYNEFMTKQVKRAGSERIRSVPADLDMLPYEGNDKKDLQLRAEMYAAMAT